jgi:hypothetical protein
MKEFVTLVQFYKENEVEELKSLLRAEIIKFTLTELNMHTSTLNYKLQVHMEDKERTLSVIKNFNESKSLQRKSHDFSLKNKFLINILSFITFILLLSIGSALVVLLGFNDPKSIAGYAVLVFTFGATAYIRKKIKSYFRNKFKP